MRRHIHLAAYWLGGLAALGAAALPRPTAFAGDWYQWRGPEQNGVSREKNLPVEWDPDAGENVLWKNDKVGGMSSPIVMDGRVYTLTRLGDVEQGGDVRASEKTQEALVCLDANTGDIVWTHAENMFQTDLPFHRLGWGNPVGDPETGNVYAYGGQGMLYALEGKTGKEVWKRSMLEEFGMISTFGGRTPSPAIDEDRLYIGGVSFGWGENSRSNYRVFCFDKKSGELLWQSGTGGIPVDAPYNTPVIAMVGGQRLCVIGSGDGTVTAFQARTGKKAWSYKVSQRGLNASCIVDGNFVYGFSSEENLKPGEPMGTIVCLDAGAPGEPKVAWRKVGIEVGFSTPTIHNGILYVCTNSARVLALDAKTGEEKWRKTAGTIGKASLVWADGKLFIPEANGRFQIWDVTGAKPEVVSRVEVPDKLGREYSIFGSVAIANGRIYLPTATTLWCIGPKDPTDEEDTIPAVAKEEPVAKDAKAAFVQVLPADAVMRPGEALKYRALAYDDKGRLIGDAKPTWSIGPVEYVAPPKMAPAVAPAPKPAEAPAGAGDKPEGAAGEGAGADAAKAIAAAQPKAPPKLMRGNLAGKVGPDGTFEAEPGPLQGGSIVATLDGGIVGKSFVRVVPPLPWKIGFTNSNVKAGPGDDRGLPPLTWIGAWWKFHAQEVDGEKVLAKLNEFDLYARARTYLGSNDMANYTIAADVRVGGKEVGGSAVMPDVGVINSRYVLALGGNHQRLTLHAWPPELPHVVNKTIDFKWEPNTWYRMKLTVNQEGDKAVLTGKVWKRDDAEPGEWTVELEDAIPNRNGPPGFFANSLVTPAKGPVYIDNIEVNSNANLARAAAAGGAAGN